ncbi:MAG TPA: hypothetical protein VHB93_00340 [Candidatus Paceibacterota bacterium]|nr:hypothetical protein [Candidatus Paceibacterota bacterium]
MSRAKGKVTKKKADTSRFSFAIRGVMIGIGVFLVLYSVGYAFFFVKYDSRFADAKAVATSTLAKIASSTPIAPPKPVLDTKAYNAKMLSLAHLTVASTTSDTSTTTLAGMTLIKPGTATTSVGAVHKLWPVSTVYPNVGALLPNNRIVAYYGNFYSKGMGVLGQYPPDEMISRLKAAVAQWQAADPMTPVIPAIDYIAVTAQGSPGADGMYRLRMPNSQIDIALDLAKQVNGIVILDVQVGDSTVQTEVPLLEKYLKMPNVHLALDPEFDMGPGVKPGTVIGTMGAAEINWAANYLAGLVKANNLPPKVLIVHRFTQNMVQNTQNITPLPEVQIVMDMDGWGFGAKKINTYNTVIEPYPVQFTGFKLFYKNDLLPPSTRMLTPSEVLDLTPSPSFIQYQ